MNLNNLKKVVIVVVIIFIVFCIAFVFKNNKEKKDNFNHTEQYILKDKDNVLEIYNVVDTNQQIISSISKEKILNYVKNKILSEQGSDPQIDSSGNRYLLETVINNNFKKIYYFEVEPWMSGTAGSTGYILSTDFKGDNIKFIDNFTSDEESLINSIQFSSDDEYLLFTNFTGTGACFNRYSYIIKTEDDTSTLINSPDMINLNGEGKILFEKLIPAEWTGSNIVEIITPQNVCSGQSQKQINWQTWQYNIETKEYKLISTDNK